MDFQPDYRHILDVLYNKRPERLPLYEHHIDLPFISKYLDREIGLEGTRPQDLEDYYRIIAGFWKDTTYDAFDYEAAICEIFPGHGAINGGMLGPIQTREDFEKYPWDELEKVFWDTYTPHFEAIRNILPDGMKAFGGCGYGIFESAQDLVGYEPFCTMQYTDPDLFKDLFIRIGDLYVTLWRGVIEKYADIFVFYRMGDDLGFKTSTLMEPDTIRNHVLPQYKRVIDLIHASGKKFLLHSCGKIFEIMEDILALDIDAKHSNEDEIAPFSRWIDLYAERIGLFGGIDVNVICLNDYDTVYNKVLEDASQFRNSAKGYGLGSGNSIAGYVPVDGFMAMIDAAKEIRKRESQY